MFNFSTLFNRHVVASPSGHWTDDFTTLTGSQSPEYICEFIRETYGFACEFSGYDFHIGFSLPAKAFNRRPQYYGDIAYNSLSALVSRHFTCGTDEIAYDDSFVYDYDSNTLWVTLTVFPRVFYFHSGRNYLY